MSWPQPGLLREPWLPVLSFGLIWALRGCVL